MVRAIEIGKKHVQARNRKSYVPVRVSFQFLLSLANKKKYSFDNEKDSRATFHAMPLTVLLYRVAFVLNCFFDMFHVLCPAR